MSRLTLRPPPRQGRAGSAGIGGVPSWSPVDRSSIWVPTGSVEMTLPPDGQPVDDSERLVTSALDLASVSQVRTVVSEYTAKWGCLSGSDVALVFSELATNAVVHAGGAVRIEILRSGPSIRIEVYDCDLSSPAISERKPTVGGWGLHIVSRLSDQWGVSNHSGGKSVWAIIPCSASPDPSS